MQKYNVIGGGFYKYILNTRTGRGSWRQNGAPLKRTERDALTEEEARAVVESNARAFCKMANVKIIEL